MPPSFTKGYVRERLDRLRVLPIAMEAGFLLSTQKNIAGIYAVTQGLHSEKLEKSEKLILPFPVSEEATRSETFVKNSNKIFQDLLNVFTGLHDILEASVFEPRF